MKKVSRGFSLLEILLATIIFTSTLGLVSALWIQFDKAQARSQARNTALFFAQSEMENCLRAGFREVDGLATPTRLNTFRWTIDGEVVTSTYDTKIEVQTPQPELKEVLVEVTYGQEDREGTVRLASTIFWSD